MGRGKQKRKGESRTRKAPSSSKASSSSKAGSSKASSSTGMKAGAKRIRKRPQRYLGSRKKSQQPSTWYRKWDFISLADSHPEIALEWHCTKNGKWTPNDFPAGSEVVAWWQCSKYKNHEWQAHLYSRTAPRGHNCPFCARAKAVALRARPKTDRAPSKKSPRKPKPGVAYGWLSKVNQKLASQWHPYRNGELTPDSVSAHSNKMVWWQCRKGHDWQARVGVRNNGHRPCPVCSMDKKSLASRYPDVAAEWHPTKNDKLTPRDVVATSTEHVWWLCAANHKWRATIANRTYQGSGCPFCAGKRASHTNCLAVLRPDLAAQWHKKKNGKLKPTDVIPGSRVVVWWQCSKKKKHCWQQSVYNRNRRESQCPKCFQRKRMPTVPYERLHKARPDLARQWHPTKNGKLKPSDFTMRSGRLAWWKCPKGSDHVWQARIATRTGKAGGGCPFCRGLRVSKTNSLAMRTPQIASEWHEKKNGQLTPAQVVYSSSKRAWWQCAADPKHVWSCTIANRTKSGCGCPYCARRLVCPSNSLASKFPRSKKLWHHERNGDLTPNQVTPGSSRKVWWQCPKETEHVWESPVMVVTRSMKVGSAGCPYCRGLKVCATNSLSYLYPDIAKEWHYKRNGKLTPKDITPGSNKYVWWLCQSGHEWKQQVLMRTSRGYGCPQCWQHRRRHRTRKIRTSDRCS